MELHGFKIDYVKKRGSLEYYFTIPRKCDALREARLADGSTQYTCGVYETRPQMCRDYDGSIDGPLGVPDCLWRTEMNRPPASRARLVQLQPSPK
jgi:hypothetical protein